MTKSKRDRIQAVANGHECPECGERGPHEDNGEKGEHLSYCCTACGLHWDASEWRAKLSERAAS